jgi:hypothetical protein
MLSSIRKAVYADSDYDPGREDYREWLDDVINKAYKALSTERLWPWAIVHDRNIEVLADVSITVNATFNSNTVASLGLFTSAMEGCTLVFYTLGAKYEYRIVQHVSINSVTLESVFQGPTGAYDVRVEQRHVLLPPNAERLLYAVCRDKEEVYYKTDSMINTIRYLNKSNVGTPYEWSYAGHRRVWAPTLPPNITLAVVPGTFSTGNWECVYTYTYMGVESAPSEIAAFTVVSGPNQSVTIGLPDTGSFSGRRKNVYLRQVITGRPRAFRLVSSAVGATTITVTYTTIVEAAWTGGRETRLPESNGSQIEYSLYHRPDANRVVQVTYLSKVASLIENTDVPLFSEAFEDVLTHAALSRVYQRNDRQSSYAAAERNYEIQKSRLKARFLTEDHATIKIGSMFKHAPDVFSDLPEPMIGTAVGPTIWVP